MGWPQIVLIILVSLDLGTILAKNGTPRGDYNFSFSLLDASVFIFLLIAGGFFN